jgi:hypothetical protein
MISCNKITCALRFEPERSSICENEIKLYSIQLACERFPVTGRQVGAKGFHRPVMEVSTKG